MFLNIKGDYILVYSVKCAPEVLKMAKRIGRFLHMPVYALLNTYRSDKNCLYGIKNVYNAGPADFLNIIENAKLVLSDSFHGNVFSIYI